MPELRESYFCGREANDVFSKTYVGCTRVMFLISAKTGFLKIQHIKYIETNQNLKKMYILQRLTSGF